ncbi:helix-turn-helix domain-containing protein [Nocardioides sp. WV_118_6]
MHSEPPGPIGRRADTRTALIDAAERLLAERGIFAVPLREVSQAAGQRNNSAAQYHFGSREVLVQAIIGARSEQVGVLRARLMSAGIAHPATQEGRARELLGYFVLPLAGLLRSAGGTSSYLRFLSRCVDEPSLLALWRAAHVEPVLMGDAYRELRGLVPEQSGALFARRMEWAAQASLRILAEQERLGTSALGELPAVCDEVLAMMASLLLRPVAPTAPEVGAGLAAVTR